MPQPLRPIFRQRSVNSGRTFAFTASSLALHTQAVLQGGFIVAKSTGDPGSAHEAVDHLRRYVELLFQDSGLAPALPGDQPASPIFASKPEGERT